MYIYLSSSRIISVRGNLSEGPGARAPKSHPPDFKKKSFFEKIFFIWIDKTVDWCDYSQRPPSSPSILHAFEPNLQIAQIIMFINLTDTYFYHLNRFNISNCSSKQLGYFSCFSSSMSNRLKSTTDCSLHALPLEKWSWILLHHCSNWHLVNR